MSFCTAHYDMHRRTGPCKYCELVSKLDRYQWTPEAYEFLMERVKQLEHENDQLRSRLRAVRSRCEEVRDMSADDGRVHLAEELLDEFVGEGRDPEEEDALRAREAEARSHAIRVPASCSKCGATLDEMHRPWCPGAD